MKTERLEIRITNELKTALQEIAYEQRRTVSQLVCIVLEDYTMAHNDEYRLTEIARAMHGEICDCDDKTCEMTTEIYDWLYNGDAANLTMADVPDLVKEWKEYNTPAETEEE